MCTRYLSQQLKSFGHLNIYFCFSTNYESIEKSQENLNIANSFEITCGVSLSAKLVNIVQLNCTFSAIFRTLTFGKWSERSKWMVVLIRNWIPLMEFSFTGYGDFTWSKYPLKGDYLLKQIFVLCIEWKKSYSLTRMFKWSLNQFEPIIMITIALEFSMPSDGLMYCMFDFD